MPKGSGRDGRETFVVDTVRLRDKRTGPDNAPQKNSLELYFKGTRLFKMEDNGVETPIESVGVPASPGFTWGRSGNTNTSTYLQNDTVPSNVTGRLITFSNASIRKVLVANSQNSTVTITVQEHDGVTYTDLASVSLVAERTKQQDFTTPITTGKMLAVKVTAGTCTDPVVGVILDGLYT